MEGATATMKRRRRKQGRQSNALEELGFGQDIPSDDFSDQPSAGSRIGGIRGAQEYGIQGGVARASDSIGSEETSEERLIDELAAASEGFAEFSAEGIEEMEEAEEGDPREYVGGEDLKNLIEDRLDHNRYLHTASIKVAVEPSGLVILSGEVPSEAESLRASEIIAALPGVLAIDNKLVVPGG